MLRGRFPSVGNTMVSGTEVPFSLKCDRCGQNAQILHKAFVDGCDPNPYMVTQIFRCVCGNEFVSVIYKKKEVNT